jgi:hypothetical protein
MSRTAQAVPLREIETAVENPDAEPVLPCEAARSAIIVYGISFRETISGPASVVKPESSIFVKCIYMKVFYGAFAIGNADVSITNTNS